MSSLIRNGSVTTFAYSGATSQHLHVYSNVALQQKPDEVIIHGGCNDVYGRNRREEATPRDIAETLINLGRKCRTAGVNKIYISSLLGIKHGESDQKATKINDILKLLCITESFTYINNGFIEKSYMKDVVHLNIEGKNMMVNNYIEYLNK